ncbi:hypothetical protein [Clostridium butyricum]|uniref:YCII-related domain-containing protein n=2 Tax=Clostridium butyricum TaxID=1492 RepID=C4IFZ2_CLOBU|nr:hypothetical protein [Clostridium butyricum]APF24405.1 hypothetical protein NPD4_2123 [Clostridium butyricum]EDT75975.1 conserved hypothetical protein [Clostridium butyricum 5521]EEP54442.1 conserved hypothetical protein [Clostridium butyricum E4 str. BoNT E BL5262]KHD17195.1 hypothetical protein OA81_02185 [Clostridium butyricum]MDB2150187.1 hypothetical protein [Clostridium butyricum]
MKYFLIEGIVTHPERMTEKIMQEHQDYTGILMKEGKVLFSSLKSDMSSSITVVKSETEQIVQDFYREDPFLKNNIITYSISELDIHYNVSDSENWFQK